MPRLAILRHQAGVMSEPFIIEQARSFSGYEPVILSRDRAAGVGPAGLESTSIESASGRRAAQLYAAGVTSRPLTNLLRELKADAVLAHFAVEGSYAVGPARRLGIPLATIVHGFDASYSTSALLRSGKPAWVNFVRRRPLLKRHGDMFLPVSTQLAAMLTAQGYPSERVRVHHTGIDLTKIPARSIDPAFTVVHIARLVEKKGTRYLLDTVARLAAEMPRLRVMCVGDGPLRTSLADHTRALGIDDRVTFTGAVSNEEALAILARGSVLCLPSIRADSGDVEGLGHVLLEAGALGLPVVASDSGGISSAVVHGVTGLLGPERGVDAICDALRRLQREPRLAAELGAAARDRVSEQFDVVKQTRVLEEVLDSLRAGGERTSSRSAEGGP